MKKVWEIFPNLAETIRLEAENTGSRGTAHDFLHDLTVGQYCLLISDEDEDTGLDAAAAGLCHSTDRRFPEETEVQLSGRIAGHLRKEAGFSTQRINWVLGLVFDHHKPNGHNDNPDLQILKDADRLANLGLPALIRCAQFYHTLPTFDVRYVGKPDPKATYKNPLTVLHDVRSALEWDPQEGKTQFCLRLPKAIELATPYFDWLRLGIALAEQQVVKTRMREFPFSAVPAAL